ncbi:GNAT family N-acetyltransferase [Micromonospora zhanjiangensis]|uniref:GNAT family N-acetyltransferase n=1 Tax=Micromonospora zhanjiangensis TaxID=1522057 RepID=A0ABV8KIE0_9ACTN
MHASPDKIEIRPGGPDDVPAVLAMFDSAVRWLVARGRTGQWGDQPRSTEPGMIDRIESWARAGELHLACLDGRPIGALGVGAALPYVPAVDEPEVYVRLLITDRAYAGRQVGARLLDHARENARARGVDLLRVDCYGGDDRALVRYYERQGFTPTVPFTVDTPRGPWLGQVLEQRLHRTRGDGGEPTVGSASTS